jgi:signal transduction histidine kinase
MGSRAADPMPARLDPGDDAFFEQALPLLAARAADALCAAHAARALAESRGDALGVVRALLLEGMAHDALGHAERDAVLADALARAQQLAEPITLIRATNSQMVVDIYHGRYADALWRGQSMLGLAHALRRNDLLWRLSINLGTALSMIGEFELAIQMFAECLGLVGGGGAAARQQRLRTVNNLAMAWLGVARAPTTAADPTAVRHALQRARQLAESACEGALAEPHGALRAGSLDTLVGVLLEDRDAAQAMAWVRRVGAASAAHFAPGTVTWGTYALAQSRAELALPGADLAAILQRLRDIEALPGPRFRGGEMHAALNQCLAEALARAGQHREALAYHRRWLQFEAKTQSLLAREHAMAVRRTLDSLRGETEEFITHDLRNPLGAALLQMDSVRAEALSAAEREALGQARRAVQRAFDTAEHYLAIVRLRNLRRADLNRIDLAELVDDVGERLAPPAGAGVRLERELDWGLEVRGDRISLLMALTQLLRNALRHAPPGSAVSWTLAAQPGLAVLTVADAGPGLDPAMRQRLLSPIGTAESQRGRGLGLTMIAKVAQLHDAPVVVAGGSGRGTRITIRFPLADAAG